MPSHTDVWSTTYSWYNHIYDILWSWLCISVIIMALDLSLCLLKAPRRKSPGRNQTNAKKMCLVTNCWKLIIFPVEKTTWHLSWIRMEWRWSDFLTCLLLTFEILLNNSFLFYSILFTSMEDLRWITTSFDIKANIKFRKILKLLWCY